MTSRSSGSVVGHSVISSSVSAIVAAGAICVGDAVEAVFSHCSLACRDHIVLSSMHMMVSASIGVGVMVTGAVGDGAVHFSIGDGGDGRFVISVIVLGGWVPVF